MKNLPTARQSFANIGRHAAGVFLLLIATSLRAGTSLPPSWSAGELTNSPLEMPKLAQWATARLQTNPLPINLAEFFSPTNTPLTALTGEELLAHMRQRLELARYLRTLRQTKEAATLLVDLLDDEAPEPIRQSALLELAAVAQDENNLSRSQQIYAQFLSKWPNDLRVPEILLRQGFLFRQMGLYRMAFTKFYGVMTSALTLKNDQFDYYQRLVLQAQMEIAETNYELGKYSEAADFFTRLLKQDNAAINKSLVLYRLVRCQSSIRRFQDAVSSAQDFLLRFPNAPEQPEVRFHLAVALKEIGRNNESLQQVLALLQEQHAKTREHPEVWAYWQQRTGNLIANQFYREGEYSTALEVYLGLAAIDSSPGWQVPVFYQVGMTYEKLWQPQKASETYNSILQREKDLGTNAPPTLKAVFDMARWRINFIQWQGRAEAANRQIDAEFRASSKSSSPDSPIALP